MAHFAKPAEGSWTEHYPHLGTGPVDYRDSTDPAWFEDEREAVFKRSWLNVGRVEQLPRVGSYFTRELEVARTSVILVRGADDTIRAFHNICRHRGNKLVWTDYPDREDKGTCRQFACKYHGWRYGLDGELTFVQQEGEFFDLDKSTHGLVPVHVDTWEGFIFIHLGEPEQTLREFLGDLGAGLDGYPFGEMTYCFEYVADVGANWKLFIDAFAEFYHAPILHMRQSVAEEAAKLAGVGFEALHYEIFDPVPHSVVSSWGGMAPPADPGMVKPIENVLRSGLFGPWDKPDIDGLAELPPGLNPARHPAWGTDSFQLYPNFVILIWEPGWYLTYHYWPTAFDRHRFEGRLYFAEPKNLAERISQELAAVTFKEFALQDGNTLEATQTMLQSGVVREFPLCDQEVLCRNLHHAVREQVQAYRAEQEVPAPVAVGR